MTFSWLWNCICLPTIMSRHSYEKIEYWVNKIFNPLFDEIITELLFMMVVMTNDSSKHEKNIIVEGGIFNQLLKFVSLQMLAFALCNATSYAYSTHCGSINLRHVVVCGFYLTRKGKQKVETWTESIPYKQQYRACDSIVFSFGKTLIVFISKDKKSRRDAVSLSHLIFVYKTFVIKSLRIWKWKWYFVIGIKVVKSKFKWLLPLCLKKELDVIESHWNYS